MIERRGPRAQRTSAAAKPASEPPPARSTVTIASVTHDVARRRSFVTLVWTDDPERRLGLPVPYGCALEAVPAAAEAAIGALAAELATIVISSA